MGTWGISAFDNDDASDWLDTIDGESLDSVTLLFDSVLSTPEDAYLEAPQCSVTLAAAELMAVALGKPGPSVPEQALSWSRNHSLKSDNSTIAKAIKAVSRIAEKSELKDLWDESSAAGDWVKAIADLKLRLQG